MLPAEGLALVAEEQLFGERARQERRRRRAERDPEAILRELAALSPGAPVVHEEYGVGRYRGLKVMQVAGNAAEFLVLEYAGGDLLYVPVYALGRVTRYTGGSPDSAPLHRLGTDQWARARRRAAERVRDVAAELLDLYSRRAARAGRPLEFDQTAYRAFEAAFPFEETVDQHEAIESVLADMRSGRPMDRVVCGDVGFGKTEVALRAAFAAVTGGRQVAVLVPTTLLAQQHAQTFADRFADWPVRVENLSRFRTGPEQRAVVAGLKAGSVDIVIGTHRLLQRDVGFNDLGLVVVDEEHRFGVTHKERLKKLRADVDMLTLTATPIPRTLNMSLGGLRDLSLMTTAPAERVAIETFVTEWSDSLVRESCLREIRRGGQVYFVHNAVEDIEAFAARLRRLVPEATVRVGHGQMRERDLEQLMLDFYHRRFQVLVCTTIIESGIDVPTANTILIDRADRFGLAQLHQLRGRVGRSHHRAFAYLLAPPAANLPDDARKRLEAIESLEDLGAGFTLATQDLEIRGAGELLGEEQSGQIQEIGIGLYLELLERAVAALREGREPLLDEPMPAGCEVDLQLPALLPEDYIPDVHLRLQLYKRLAGTDDRERLDDLGAEIIDRFGPLPPPAKTLLVVHGLRQRAAALGIRRLELGAAAGLVEFGPAHQVEPDRVVRLVQQPGGRYRLDGPTRLRHPNRRRRCGWPHRRGRVSARVPRRLDRPISFELQCRALGEITRRSDRGLPTRIGSECLRSGVATVQAHEAHEADGIRRFPQPVEQRLDCLAVIADRQHVATRFTRQLRARHDVPEGCCARHRQVVREHRALETELAAQHAADPGARQARRFLVHRGEHHVRHHHRRQAVRDQAPVRLQVRLDVGPCAPVHGQRDVRIGGDRAMPGKMLAGRRHAGIPHAQHVGDAELGDRGGIRVQRAVTNCAADAVVDIHAGRERHIHADGTELRRHQPTEVAREGEPFGTTGRVAAPDFAQRRQPGESRLEALNAPAFLVHGHEQGRRADRVDLGGEARHLLRALVVAREEDHAADLRVAQHLALLQARARCPRGRP